MIFLCVPFLPIRLSVARVPFALTRTLVGHLSTPPSYANGAESESNVGAKPVAASLGYRMAVRRRRSKQYKKEQSR